MTVISGFSALVVVGIILRATGKSWFVSAAFALDVIGGAAVAMVVLRMTAMTGRPGPTLVAATQGRASSV